MPYINEPDNEFLDPTGPATTEGELNYQLSACAAAYIEANGLSYANLNAVSGAFTEALAEFRRRIVVPYEEVKQRTGVDPYKEIRPEATEPSQAWVARMTAPVR